MSKLNNVADLIRDDIVTVHCMMLSHINRDEDGKLSFKEGARSYTYKCKRELAKELNTLDLVLVEGHKFFNMVLVVKIDEIADIDVDSGFNYHWIFQKIDQEALKSLKAQERHLVQQLQQHQRQVYRNQALHSLGLDSHEVQTMLHSSSEDSKDA